MKGWIKSSFRNRIFVTVLLVTLLPMLLEERPAAVSFHFGAPPRDQVRALQAAGIRVLVSATTPEEAALVTQEAPAA